jgi:hypothetical protein
MMRWQRELLTKELNRFLRRRAASMVIHRTKTLSSSYLGESLLLHILNALLQGDDLGSLNVNHLMMLSLTGLEVLDLLSLRLHFSNKIISHIGQLIDLDILSISVTVELINNSPYMIGRISNKIYMLLQTIHRMVLSMISFPQGVLEMVNLCQEMSPSSSGKTGVPLAPHLALSLLWLKEPLFQQTVQQPRKLFVIFHQ